MLRRLCQKRILHHLKKQTFSKQWNDFPSPSIPLIRDSQQSRCIQSIIPVRSVVNHSAKKSKSIQDDTEFLQKYPDAYRYEGKFAINVQPFSINAPVYLGNFINDLGHTLKIPYVYSNGYSAAMCLEKICRARDKGSLLENTLEEGITREEWHEIFLAVNDEISYLDGLTTISLISLSFKVKDFRKNVLEKLIIRFQSLLSSHCSVKSLCKWSDILRENECYDLRYVNLLEMIWKKILSKQGHIAASDLLTLYQALPKRLNHMFPDFYKDFERNLPNLKVYDLFMIGMELEQKSDRTNEFKLMVGWLQKNLYLIQTEDLEAIIMNFQSAGYVDGFLLNVLSRHVHKLRRTGQTVDKHFMEVTLNYSTLTCFYDENILEIACDMFIESKEDYTHDEMEILLKAIGTLNHTPRRSWEFFKKVEEYICREVFMLKPEMLLDFTTYLIYIDRPLFNLKDFIFSPTFQGLIRDLKDDDPKLFRQCLKHLHLIRQAFLEVEYDPFPYLELPERDVYQRLTSVEYKEEGIYNYVVDALEQLIPSSEIGHFPRPTFDENYIEIQTDTNGIVLETRHPDNIWSERCRKAIIILGRDDYCSMMGKDVSDHMLGSQQANINILKNQGVDVYTIHTKEILDMKKKKSLHEYIKNILQAKPVSSEGFRGRVFEDDNYEDVCNDERVDDDICDDVYDDFYQDDY